MVSIGGAALGGRVVLAPMAGVTDAAFRSVCAEMGAALVYTEMVSAQALCYGDKKTAALLAIPDGSRPTAAQIFGHDVNYMARGAKIAYEICGAELIDINMGCPVGKIVRSGDGSALMKTPELAGEIVAAVAAAVPVPVTVKIRKGWDSGCENAVELAKICESAGAAAIAVHGRTRVQMYSGRADWDAIRDVVSAVSVPVIANGDVFTAGDAVHILKYTNAAACMIGRGAMGDPWLFARANAALDGREIPPVPSVAERMDTALRVTELAAEYKGEHIACIEARGRLPHYLHGVEGSSYWKRELTGVSTLGELRDCVRGIKRELR